MYVCMYAHVYESYLPFLQNVQDNSLMGSSTALFSLRTFTRPSRRLMTMNYFVLVTTRHTCMRRYVYTCVNPIAWVKNVLLFMTASDFEYVLWSSKECSDPVYISLFKLSISPVPGLKGALKANQFTRLFVKTVGKCTCMAIYYKTQWVISVDSEYIS